jgi:hypothetical protein
MDVLKMARLKELEAENTWLKKMYTEARLKTDIPKETIEKEVSTGYLNLTVMNSNSVVICWARHCVSWFLPLT